MQPAACSRPIYSVYTRVSQKSEPHNILQQQPQIRSDLNKILHTQDDICYRHYYVVSYKSALTLLRYEFLHNVTLNSRVSIAVDVGQNSQNVVCDWDGHGAGGAWVSGRCLSGRGSTTGLLSTAALPAVKPEATATALWPLENNLKDGRMFCIPKFRYSALQQTTRHW